MAQYLLPGFGDVDETGSGQYLLPGYGDTNETVSSGVTGTSATTNANDAAAAAGTTTITGALATTNARDVSAASGTTTVTGTSTTTNASDVAAASGEVGSGATGSSATTNADDIASAAGTTTVMGSATCVNVGDVCAASGTGPAQTALGGGFFEVPSVKRWRTVREERERLGILPREVKQVVLAVARASVVADKTDYQAEQQLERRLQQQDIEATARHVEFMKAERDRILSRDIERALRIRRRQMEMDEDEREAELLLM